MSNRLYNQDGTEVIPVAENVRPFASAPPLPSGYVTPSAPPLSSSTNTIPSAPLATQQMLRGYVERVAPRGYVRPTRKKTNRGRWGGARKSTRRIKSKKNKRRRKKTRKKSNK